MSTEKVTLADGSPMPVIGLGTYQVTDGEELKESLKAALDYGYRHIDTAYFYENEHFINEVLAEYFSAKKLYRPDVFVTSKLWITFLENKDTVRLGIERSLQNLGLNYIDLYIIHFPTGLKHAEHLQLDKIEFVNDKSCIINAWKMMEEYVDQGKLKSIGVSNFNIEQLKRIKEIAKHPIACNQIEFHVFLQQPELYEYCQKENIRIVAYAPLGSTGRSWGQEWTSTPPMQDPLVMEIAKDHKKTAAQILLRFLLQRNLCIIPKSVKPSRVRENFDIFDFKLSDKNMKALMALDKNERSFEWPFARSHIEYPF